MSNLQFTKDLEHGKIGEKWFHDYCIDKGILCINVGDDGFLGIESGIDFIVQYPKGNVAKFDVKFDSRMGQTGNMFIEIYQDRDKKGWYYNSKANRYCYIDEYNGVLWMYSKKTLEGYIDTHKSSIKSITSFIDGREVTGLLINIEKFCTWCEEKNRKVIKYVRMFDIEDIDDIL